MTNKIDPATADWLQSNAQHHSERLGFILCFAAALHLTAILGISFASNPPSLKLPSIEVTLARYQSQEKPQDADYIAQFDQIGSGTLEHKAEPTTTTQSAFHDNRSNPDQVMKMARQNPLQSSRELVKSQSSGTRSAPSETAAPQLDRIDNGSDQVTELSKDISSLEAQLADINQSYASMPRPKFITSVATRGSPDALYLNRWESHIERIGNENYPQDVRRAGLEGELRLLLMLFPDGRIDEVRILRSSGEPLLDRAAHRIVRLAAPYEAIPEDVLDGKNRLGIVRTWRFENTRLTATGG